MPAFAGVTYAKIRRVAHYRSYFQSILFLIIFQQSFAEEATVIPEVSLVADPASATTNDNENFTSLSEKKIAQAPATSLADLLQDQSTVRLSNNSGDTSQTILSVRGFGDNAVANSLLVVDGFPLLNSSLLAPNLNAILLSDLSKIDIFQGSQGSLWGDQAVGGVMEIQTKHPEKQFGEVNLGYGSDNKQLLSGIFGDKWQNGFFYKISGYTNHTGNYRVHNQQANHGVSAEEGVDYAEGTLSVNEKVYEDTVNFPGALTEAQYNQNPRQATDTTDYAHFKTQAYQLLDKQALNEGWLLETRLSSTMIHGYGFFYSPFDTNEWLNRFNPALKGKFGQNKFQLGYVRQSSHFEDSSVGNVPIYDNADENDLYAQTILPFWKRWDLSLGARSAWQENFPNDQTDHVFVSEQGINFHPKPALTFFVRRDGNFRFPKANEEVFLAQNVTGLKPQTGVSYETGATWKTRAQKTQLSVYDLQLNNEIAYDPTQTPTQPFGATSNFDPTQRYGITLSHEAFLTKYFSTHAEANYVDARFSSGPYRGNFIPAVPAWNGNASVSYQFLTHWKTSYRELYTGSAYASDDLNNVAKKASPYWMSDWSLQYFLKKLTMSFSVNNLFNQRYAIYTVYSVNTATNSYYPGTGRNYLLSLKASMG